mgnify:CR=1 FL=1
MNILLSVVLLLILFAGLGGVFFYAFKIANASVADTSIGDRIETAQDFLPFQDIGYNMVDLGNHQYRAYIEVSSINYFLRTDDEKHLVELSFQRFLNSLSHPITFFVQTRVANSQELLAALEADYLKTIERYPFLETHAVDNFNEMAALYQERGTDREKRKYIIVPFDEAVNLTEVDDNERRAYAQEELYQRCRIIMDGLANVGLKSKILSTSEIVELVFSTYHKQNYSHFKAILEGEYSSLIVDGRDRIQETNEEGRLDWVLYETQMKLQQEVLSLSNDEDVQRRAREAIVEIEAMRTALAGYFQQSHTSTFSNSSEGGLW